MFEIRAQKMGAVQSEASERDRKILRGYTPV